MAALGSWELSWGGDVSSFDHHREEARLPLHRCSQGTSTGSRDLEVPLKGWVPTCPPDLGCRIPTAWIYLHRPILALPHPGTVLPPAFPFHPGSKERGALVSPQGTPIILGPFYFRGLVCSLLWYPLSLLSKGTPVSSMGAGQTMVPNSCSN